MVFKSLSRLLGAVAMTAVVSLAGAGVASAANPPSDGGDSSCAPDKHNCYLYHFKLDGKGHSIQFTTYDDPCQYWNTRANFTVKRKNSANIWLDPAVTKYFFINFDNHPAGDLQGMAFFGCGGGGGVKTFTNNQNLCWHLLELRTRGSNCDWH
jgi:hypothetical protein